MRCHGVWMLGVDERILEQLVDADDPMTAWELAHDLEEVTREHVAARCKLLADAGFAVQLPRDGLEDRYDITGWGQRYLLGEIDADHRRPEPAPRPPEAVRPGWYAELG